MVSQDELKKAAALEAVKFIKNVDVVGVGTGSTVNYFIDALAAIKGQIQACVASSEATAKRLKSHGIQVEPLNSVADLGVYVDGADEFNEHLYLIKGGGGALTREKVIAAAAQQFICIVDQAKRVDVLGKFPLAVEVIAMARSYVAREIVQLGGEPVYRQGVTTDNGNVILDVHNLNILDPVQLEVTLNSIPGVVCNGLFAKRRPNQIVIGAASGIQLLS